MQQAGLSPVRPARAKHRHELRTLTYVSLDEANGGVVRNLNHEGIGMQAVAAVRPRQLLRVRFELRDPRLRVEADGEVTWAAGSGECGIRFIDLPPRTTRQINEWIFGDLLAGAALHPEAGPMFAASVPSVESADGMDDGLMVSAGSRKVIELAARFDGGAPVVLRDTVPDTRAQLDWLSQPLSGKSLIWTINTLAVFAALLLFALIFLTVAGEAPQWPLATAGAAVFCVGGLYWGFFQLFGGSSPGARLARMLGSDSENDRAGDDARFR
jgi:PilZ domain